MKLDCLPDTLPAPEPVCQQSPVPAQVLSFPERQPQTVSADSQIGQFAASQIELREGQQVQASALHDAFTNWCAATGNEPVNQTVFGTALAGLGFAKVRTNRVYYTGIALASQS